jgi:hypothetical protein
MGRVKAAHVRRRFCTVVKTFAPPDQQDDRQSRRQWLQLLKFEARGFAATCRIFPHQCARRRHSDDFVRALSSFKTRMACCCIKFWSRRLRWPSGTAFHRRISSDFQRAGNRGTGVSNFQRFVLRHIDETMPADQASAIDDRAAQCQRDTARLCLSIRRRIAYLRQHTRIKMQSSVSGLRRRGVQIRSHLGAQPFRVDRGIV